MAVSLKWPRPSHRTRHHQRALQPSSLPRNRTKLFMPDTSSSSISNNSMDMLSRLLLSPSVVHSQPTTELRNMQRESFDALSALASTNHVFVRSMEAFRGIMFNVQDQLRAEWAAGAIEVERARIIRALGFLRLICDPFDE